MLYYVLSDNAVFIALTIHVPFTAVFPAVN